MLSSTVEIKMPVLKLTPGKIDVSEEGDLSFIFAVKCLSHPQEIARVASLLKQKVPLYCIVGSPQAVLDLQTVSIEVGKPASPQLPLENAAVKTTPENQATEAEKADHEAGKDEAAGELAATEEKTPEGNHNHNGHDIAADLKNTVDISSFIDLTTFDQRPPDGKGIVPAAFYLLGTRVDCVEGNLKIGLLKLFTQFGIVAEKPEDMIPIFEKYPESDNKTIILEILKAPDAEVTQPEKPRRTRKKKTEETSTNNESEGVINTEENTLAAAGTT